MKNLVLIVGLLVAANAQASTCTATTEVPSQYLSGSCSGGNCSGFLPDSPLSVSGICSDGSEFQATANPPGGFLSVRCMGNTFSTMVSGGEVEWMGSCSKGVLMASPSFVGGSSLMGTCSENGPFSAWTETTMIEVNATCN